MATSDAPDIICSSAIQVNIVVSNRSQTISRRMRVSINKLSQTRVQFIFEILASEIGQRSWHISQLGGTTNTHTHTHFHNWILYSVDLKINNRFSKKIYYLLLVLFAFFVFVGRCLVSTIVADLNKAIAIIALCHSLPLISSEEWIAYLL